MAGVLSPNPRPPGSWPALLCTPAAFTPAAGQPGNLLSSTTISGLLGEGVLLMISSLSDSQKDSEAKKGSRGWVWVVQKEFLRAAKNTGWRGLLLSQREAGCSRLAARPLHPALQPPAHCSDRGPPRCLLRGRAKFECISRGCFPSQWTKHFWRFREGTEHSVHFGACRIPGRTQMCFTCNKINYTTSSVLGLARPTSRPTRFPGYPPYSRANLLRRPFQVASGSEH